MKRFVLGAMALWGSFSWAQEEYQEVNYTPKYTAQEKCVEEEGKSTYEGCLKANDPQYWSFSMIAPSDWKVDFEKLGYAVFMEPLEKRLVTVEQPRVMDPNLSVSVTRNPIPIDQESLDEFENLMVTEFIKQNGEASQFKVLQKTIQEGLPNGQKGLLYYATFYQGEDAIQQAILVLSSHLVRYKIVFTDYHIQFEKTFTQLFPAMTSIKVYGEPMVRVPLWQEWARRLAIPVGVGTFCLLLLGWVSMARKRRIHALLKEDQGYGEAMPASGYPLSGYGEPSQSSSTPMSASSSLAPSSESSFTSSAFEGSPSKPLGSDFSEIASEAEIYHSQTPQTDEKEKKKKVSGFSDFDDL